MRCFNISIYIYIYMASFIHRFITSQKPYKQGYIHIEVPQATSSFYRNCHFWRFAHNTVDCRWLIPMLDAILYKLQLIISSGPQPFIAIGVCPWLRSNAISLSVIASHIWSGPYLRSDFPMRYRYWRSQVAYGQGLTSTPISRCDNHYQWSQIAYGQGLTSAPISRCDVPDPIGSQISRAYIFKSSFRLR